MGRARSVFIPRFLRPSRGGGSVEEECSAIPRSTGCARAEYSGAPPVATILRPSGAAIEAMGGGGGAVGIRRSGKSRIAGPTFSVVRDDPRTLRSTSEGFAATTPQSLRSASSRRTSRAERNSSDVLQRISGLPCSLSEIPTPRISRESRSQCHRNHRPPVPMAKRQSIRTRRQPVEMLPGENRHDSRICPLGARSLFSLRFTSECPASPPHSVQHPQRGNSINANTPSASFKNRGVNVAAVNVAARFPGRLSRADKNVPPLPLRLSASPYFSPNSGNCTLTLRSAPSSRPGAAPMNCLSIIFTLRIGGSARGLRSGLSGPSWRWRTL